MKNDGLYLKWRNHDYMLAFLARRRHLGIPSLCRRCARGWHNLDHDERGCTEIVGQEPNDYVCRCQVAAPSSVRAEIIRRLRAISAGVLRS